MATRCRSTRLTPIHVMHAAALLVGLLQFSGGAQAQKLGSSGGRFELTDQNGNAFSSAGLAGKPYAIFFGFTNCPDVCPTTLLQMSNHLAALGQDADRLRVLFVTVDPERDTPDHLRTYLSSFDHRIIGLTGTAEQIAATAKAWNVFYNRVPEDGGTYSMVHSAHIYLMDANNRLGGTLNFQDTEADQLSRLRALISGSGAGRGG